MNTLTPQETIDNCIDQLNNGNIILYPTDTIWGIGCDPFNEDALEKIFKLKNRSPYKSFILLVSSPTMLGHYVSDIPQSIIDIIENDTSPTTIIYSTTKNLPAFLLAKDGSIGIRIIKHPLITNLIEQSKKPIISTSANISGESSPLNFVSISEKIKNGVDYIIPKEFDSSKGSQPSKIILQKADGNLERLR